MPRPALAALALAATLAAATPALAGGCYFDGFSTVCPRSTVVLPRHGHTVIVIPEDRFGFRDHRHRQSRHHHRHGFGRHDDFGRLSGPFTTGRIGPFTTDGFSARRHGGFGHHR